MERDEAGGAPFENRSYFSTATSSSDRLMGPYGDRYLAVPHGGHNMIFRDRQGAWWSTFFGSDPVSPFSERLGLLRIEFSSDGRIRPLPTRP